MQKKCFDLCCGAFSPETAKYCVACGYPFPKETNRPLHLIGVPESPNIHETPPERKFPGFELLMGRKPVAGKDYSEEGDFCQDDAEYFSGTGRYSNDFNEVAKTEAEREELREQILTLKAAFEFDYSESARKQFPEMFGPDGKPLTNVLKSSSPTGRLNSERPPAMQNIPIPVTGGTFTLTHGGNVSEPLPHDATPEQIEAAVEEVTRKPFPYLFPKDFMK
jgi:hypothetical protein